MGNWYDKSLTGPGFHATRNRGGPKCSWRLHGSPLYRLPPPSRTRLPLRRSARPSCGRPSRASSEPPRRSAEVYLQRRVAILEKQVKSLRLAAGALAEAAYLGDTLEPSDSEDEMEAESDLDNGDEEITDLVSDGENA